MSKRKLMQIHTLPDVKVIDMGPMEIWDGADLSLLRETLTRLVDEEGCHSVGVNMTFVKYIPSGFFGMMYDWSDRGVDVRLYTPQSNVQSMLWFRQFFQHESHGCFMLVREPKQPMTATPPAGWTQAAGEEIEVWTQPTPESEMKDPARFAVPGA
jgi:hypothetical protein